MIQKFAMMNHGRLSRRVPRQLFRVLKPQPHPFSSRPPRVGIAAAFAGILLALSGAPALHAQEIEKTFELRGYQQATNPTADISPFISEFYFVPFIDNSADAGTPTPDYLVFNGISPAIVVGEEDPTFLFSGGYTTYGGENGTALGDSGNLVLNIPDIPEDSPNSNIVGYVRRSGTVTSVPSTPLGGLLAGANGTFRYPSNLELRDTTVTLTLADNTVLTAETEMLVNSRNVVVVDPIDPDPTDFDSILIGGFNVLRSNDDPSLYVATVRRIDNQEPSEWYDQRAILVLRDDEDTDMDGIPDFSDLQVSYFPFFADMSLGGHWYYASWMESAVYAVANDWNYTTAMQWLYAPSTQKMSEGIWFYSPSDSVEWFWTSSELFPYFYRRSDGAVLYYHKDADGAVWLYNYDTRNWEAPGL